VLFVAQQNNTTFNGAAALSHAMPANAGAYTAGNFVAVLVALSGTAGGAPISLTDSLGNTYTSAIQGNLNSNTLPAGIFFIQSALVGTATITITASQTWSVGVMVVLEFSGVAGGLDKTASSTSSSSATITTGTTAATAQASELAIALIGDNPSLSQETFSLPAGYTAEGIAFVANTVEIATWYQFLAATGTQSATSTPSSADANQGGMIATFAAVAAGAGVPFVPTLPTIPTIPTIYF
jgi:hypothetical protein